MGGHERAEDYQSVEYQYCCTSNQYYSVQYRPYLSHRRACVEVCTNAHVDVSTTAVESYSTPSHLYLYMFLYFLLTAYFVVGMWVPNMSNILITPVLFSPE